MTGVQTCALPIYGELEQVLAVGVVMLAVAAGTTVNTLVAVALAAHGVLGVAVNVMVTVALSPAVGV